MYVLKIFYRSLYDYFVRIFFKILHKKQTLLLCKIILLMTHKITFLNSAISKSNNAIQITPSFCDVGIIILTVLGNVTLELMSTYSLSTSIVSVSRTNDYATKLSKLRHRIGMIAHSDYWSCCW